MSLEVWQKKGYEFKSGRSHGDTSLLNSAENFNQNSQARPLTDAGQIILNFFYETDAYFLKRATYQLIYFIRYI